MSEQSKSKVRRLCRAPRLLAQDYQNSDGAAPTCSFCSKAILEVRFLVSGTGATICNDCVVSFASLLAMSARPDHH